jgi:hypothetical protein
VQEERHRIKRRRRPQCFIEGIGSLKLQLNFNLREIQWGIEGLKYRKLSAIKVLTILLRGAGAAFVRYVGYNMLT